MNLGEIRDYTNYISRKERNGLSCTPEEFNSILQVVSLKQFKRTYGLPEDYQPGQAIPRIAFELNQLVIDRIHRHIVRKGDPDDIPLMPDTNGQALIPADYCHYASLTYRYSADGVVTERPVDVLTVDQRAKRLVNSITAPTKKNPCCCFFKDYIEFYPKTLQYVNFIYLRLPVTPVYGCLIDANDVETYDPLTSTELDFDAENHMEIVNLLIQEMGINLSDDRLEAYAQKQTREGQ
jgi:hypothetical protein